MSTPLVRRIALGAGAAALVIAHTAGCSNSSTTEDAPTTATTPASATAPATSAPAVSPTEKAVGPGGDNSFSPTIDPTPPGAVCKEVVGGVCIR